MDLEGGAYKYGYFNFGKKPVTNRLMHSYRTMLGLMKKKGRKETARDAALYGDRRFKTEYGLKDQALDDYFTAHGNVDALRAMPKNRYTLPSMDGAQYKFSPDGFYTYLNDPEVEQKKRKPKRKYTKSGKPREITSRQIYVSMRLKELAANARAAGKKYKPGEAMIQAHEEYTNKDKDL